MTNTELNRQEQERLHILERDLVASALVSEIHGPHPDYDPLNGTIKTTAVPVDLAAPLHYNGWESYRPRFVEKTTGEEIIKDEAPSKLYGLGILFPLDSAAPHPNGEADQGANPVAGESTGDDPSDTVAAAEASSGFNSGNPTTTGDVSSMSKDSAQEKRLSEKIARMRSRFANNPILRSENGEDEPASEDDIAAGDDELDGLKLARVRKPQSMGITFACRVADNVTCAVAVSGGRYRMFTNVRVSEKERTFERKWWVRVPVSVTLTLSAQQLRQNGRYPLTLSPDAIPGLKPLKLSLEIISRPLPHTAASDTRLITATLVNRTSATREVDKEALFQSRFTIEAADASGAGALVPIPRGLQNKDPEELGMELLYRNARVFAAGHGCAGVWKADEGATVARRVIAEPIPAHETAPVTPDLVDPDTRKPLEIPMLPLARAETGWMAPLERLLTLYRDWIEKRSQEIASLPAELRDAAKRHLDACRHCAARIDAGLGLLRTDAIAAEAFKLTNEAVLLQQLAGARKTRALSFDQAGRVMTWDDPPDAATAFLPSLAHPHAGNRKWRPFQIAFLLMSLPGLFDEKSDDRAIADLIWFPTGGGKTEAYLGASAFALLARRLQDPEDDGTTVIMRYTLRLLTAQQYQRASGLICALETIRRRAPARFGKTPFTIGIWVGGSTTPNKKDQSLEAYKAALQNGPEAYSHIMLRCPWCASAMGPRRRGRGESGKSYYSCDGLRLTGAGESRSVAIHCPDRRCTFHEKLPVSVVDEELYEAPPSLFIGTVDKFAMLAWRPSARALFGLAMDGSRQKSPPALIIQDELHLITGPLGSMVGLYEGVVEELCTDRRGPRPVKPKLVASTATTRASTRQIRELYARQHTAIFPPPGLDAGDSFFACYNRFPASHPDAGKIKPGRRYLGVMGRAYGSGLTVSVRVFSSLCAAGGRARASATNPSERAGSDAWWTLLAFYNSLRELGQALTLFSADIPERLSDIRDRWFPGEKRRYLREDGVMELTGRLNNSEVPVALARLERKLPADGTVDYQVVDACLASNIIEVGVDVPRLGLMAVAGQPKNTAQYIQATGRVGREFPGLVVMIYDNGKPRDLSHFEQFTSYHSRLYAQVEPSSVTPFTLPVLERALHGAMIAWMRQKLPEDAIRLPRPMGVAGTPLESEFMAFAKMAAARVELLFADDPAAKQHALTVLRQTLARRRSEWSGSDPSAWENREGEGDLPLMRFYGTPCPPQWQELTWETPTSMRGVDAECAVSIYPEAAQETTPAAATIPEDDGMDAIFGKST